MVVMSFEDYKRANETIENALDVADRQAQTMPLRYSHGDVFDSVREMISHGSEAQAL